MAESETNEPDDLLSVRDMRNFLDYEITAVTKAAELRLRELGALVTSYAAGELTPQQAGEQLDRYQSRWGEALPGVWKVEGATDEEILAKVNQAEGKHASAERKRNIRPFRDHEPGT